MGHFEGVEYTSHFHHSSNQYYMYCIHYGNYTSSAKSNEKKETASTFRKNCKAFVLACQEKKPEGDSQIIIKSFCSEHNHAQYTQEELFGLRKVKDMPTEVKEIALKRFLEGQNVSDIMPILKSHFENK